MSPRWLFLLVVWLIPSFAFAQDQKQGVDPEAARLLQEKIDRLTREVKELEARQAKLKATAEEEARAIIAQARAEAARINRTAEAEAHQILRTAETEAARLVNEASVKDPELYAFLKRVDAMKTLLANSNTTLLIPSKSEWFDLFVEPPRQKRAPEQDPEGKAGPARGTLEKADRSEEFRRIWREELGQMLRKMRDEGRLQRLDEPGARGLELVVPRTPPGR